MASQARTAGSVGSVVVADQVDVEVAGTLALILARNFLNSIERSRRCRLDIAEPSAATWPGAIA